MKRLLTLAAACLLSLGLVACAPDDEAALVVNGDEVLTQGELDELLDEFADDEDFLTAVGGRGVGADTLDLASGVLPALNNFVLANVIEDELDRLEFAREESDEPAGEQLLVNAFQIPIEVEDGAQPTEAQVDAALEETIPPRYLALLRDFAAEVVALRRYLDPDGTEDIEAINAAQQDFLSEVMPAADVEVASRYGTWDAPTGQIVPPTGPVGATTTLPAVPAGG